MLLRINRSSAGARPRDMAEMQQSARSSFWAGRNFHNCRLLRRGAMTQAPVVGSDPQICGSLRFRTSLFGRTADCFTPITQRPRRPARPAPLRDEGTSYHYMPPAEFSEADPPLVEQRRRPWPACVPPCCIGAMDHDILFFGLCSCRADGLLHTLRAECEGGATLWDVDRRRVRRHDDRQTRNRMGTTHPFTRS
jgi:hypothetical protein